MKSNSLLSLLIVTLFLLGCEPNKPKPKKKTITAKSESRVYYGNFDVPKPNPDDWKQFDKYFVKDTNYVNEFGLAVLPKSYYEGQNLVSTLASNSKSINTEELEVHFFPLNQDTAQNYQYVHEYTCAYDPLKVDRYAEVAYPSPCLGQGVRAKARVVIRNKTNQTKRLKGRLFYQNNSYGFVTNTTADFANKLFLNNYYGGSDLQTLTIRANSTKEFWIPYKVGIDPKGNSADIYNFYYPARPGAYEFMFWVSEAEDDPLLQNYMDYALINPFAYYSEQLKNGDTTISNRMAHTHAKHFKFITLLETFADNKKDYANQTVFTFGDRDEKPLCDTCTGYFKDVIAEEWVMEDFFEGYINQSPWIKADYGNRKENVRIDENGIYLRSPASTPQKKQKTWGEVKFQPAFLFGTVKAVIKFSQLRNLSKTPTGIVHNLWLYQRNPGIAPPIPGHPYAYLTNSEGHQPYEIDIEIWSKIYDENWGGGASINYSVVDYMRDQNSLVKPGESKDIEGAEVDRINNIQLNYPGKELLYREFFEDYHLYEIVWSPYDIFYKIDGKIVAKIDWRMAKIPDVHAFLWIGSPIYQDGTYYTQSKMPFLPYDAITHIRYLSIE